MDDTFLLVYNDVSGTLHVSKDVLPVNCIILDSFARYDDAIDAMNDIRALCVGGISIRNVIEMTYGELMSVDGGDTE